MGQLSSAFVAAVRGVRHVRGRRRAAWRARWARAGVSALLTQLATPPTAEGVQAVLRSALGDPTAAVFYRLPEDRLPEGDEFVSASGESVTSPAGEAGRRTFPVLDRDGRVTALLSTDASTNPDSGYVEAALAVCRPALENARLQAVLRGRLREVSASRARIVQTAVAERRRLARDLHDGAQQHLLVLSTRLGLARQEATQPQSLAAIDAARDQLRIALSKLRGLGRDLYPAVLDTEGLAAALESLADNSPVEVDVLVSTVGRLGSGAEIIVYFTVREIVEGLAWHAKATRARVTVAAEAERLIMRITSDGAPGDTGTTPWLSIVSDRIKANGGDISIGWSPALQVAQGGIWVEAWIPCASSW